MPFTPEQEDRIRALIADALGWSATLKQTRQAAQHPESRASQRDLAIADAYERGASLLECGTRFGCSPSAVRTSLHRAGVATRPKGPRPNSKRDARADAFAAQREAGATLEEIAASAKITRERVRQILTKAGVSTSSKDRPLTPEQRALVERYIRGSESLGLSASLAGVSAPTFRNWVLRCGYSPRTLKRPMQQRLDDKASEVARLYSQGQKVAEIAVAVGLPHPEAVYRLLGRAGVRPNRNHGAGRWSRQEAA